MACKKQESIEITESEPHPWLECRNNGQNTAWETAKNIWEKSTERPWPDISIGLANQRRICDNIRKQPHERLGEAKYPNIESDMRVSERVLQIKINQPRMLASFDNTNLILYKVDLLSMTISAIWKSRNKNTINNQDVAPGEASSTLKELIRDLMRNSWNATRFLEGSRRKIRQRALRTLWADGHLIDYNPKTGSGVTRL